MTCSQRISLYYLHNDSFIHHRNHAYLPLPSQLQLVLIYRPQMDGTLNPEIPALIPGLEQISYTAIQFYVFNNSVTELLR